MFADMIIFAVVACGKDGSGGEGMVTTEMRIVAMESGIIYCLWWWYL